MNESNMLWSAQKSVVEEESPAFLRDQLITYLGNKRSLLDLISVGVNEVKLRLSKDKLSILDGFAGSGIVSRFFKQHSSHLISNDLELYSSVIAKCYLSNKSEVDIDLLLDLYEKIIAQSKADRVEYGIVRRNYSPKCDDTIQLGERVFYTASNAIQIDSIRKAISVISKEHQHFFLAPLLSAASVHANTSGVFKGFYKNSETGIGQFGGNGRNALTRILKQIELQFPIFSRFESEVDVYTMDTNVLVQELPDIDLAYFDPPYNQHPYGSNYFMLNLILNNVEPEKTSRVSGIPTNWNRSDYNKRQKALFALDSLIENTQASHILISYNNEGFVSTEEFNHVLEKYGKYDIFENQYNTFRGCRNLRNRSTYVTEYLYLLERN